MHELLEPRAGSTATDYLADLAGVLALVPSEALDLAAGMLLRARAEGRRVYVLGNGGSAATASHFVCDLVKTAQVAGLSPLRAFALGDNIPLLTAWANDRAYERCFAEQVAALVDAGDIVIGISASGNSPNVVAALRSAAERGATTIGLLGFDGGAARALVDLAIHVPCDDYGLVEDAHSAIGHVVPAQRQQRRPTRAHRRLRLRRRPAGDR
jgi:D-sedoheptulose 7-phosphate isomerase